ncbi:E3 SUMO-protein ligase NSE2 [Wickerhamiella sorbophila]|uniref:E3 SUMO-protein ligase NSE2 n=1 Tax=Wickerhamiella sorbophila TaxID=45607 RepID=A0A2T0FLL6_9ASCO|nr:E3 SUMO-protein ligase NSE2 [Wickerhamiella sorbophila]PRT55872.1 E3 SUMO-protein ligase NSE2 [Wickerhamiella sorbophila]
MADLDPDLGTRSYPYSRAVASTVAAIGSKYDSLNDMISEYQSSCSETAQLLRDISVAVQNEIDGAEISLAIEDHLNALNSEFVASMRVEKSVQNDTKALKHVQSYASTHAQALGQSAQDVLASEQSVDALNVSFSKSLEQQRQKSSTRTIPGYTPVQMDSYVRFRNAVAGGSIAPTPLLTASDVVQFMELEEVDDDGIMIGRTVRDYKCPITGEYLQNPVRARCGHHFSRDAVLQYIEELSQTNGDEVACPVSGCPYPISVTELVPDAGIELLVNAAWKRERQRTHSARAQATSVQ